MAVIRHVAGGRAHVLGYSYGGAIALQLALDASEAVHSLSLLEVGLAVPSTVPSAAAAEARAARAAMYESGDKAGAIDAFLSMAIGRDYRESIDRTLTPGWFERSVEDLDTLFQVEGPALREWQFTEELSRPISQPVLSVVGAESKPESGVFARESHALLEQWLPQAEAFILPGATHGLQLQNPHGMAEGLAAFLARHPMLAGQLPPA